MSDAYNIASPTLENSSGFKDANIIIPYVTLCSSPTLALSSASASSSASSSANSRVGSGKVSKSDEKSSAKDASTDKDLSASKSMTICSSFKHVSVKVEPVGERPLIKNSLIRIRAQKLRENREREREREREKEASVKIINPIKIILLVSFVTKL